MMPGKDERSKWKSAILHNEGLKDWAVELQKKLNVSLILIGAVNWIRQQLRCGTLTEDWCG